eukprot:1844461-Prymnesium_polylepis.1
MVLEAASGDTVWEAALDGWEMPHNQTARPSARFSSDDTKVVCWCHNSNKGTVLEASSGEKVWEAELVECEEDMVVNGVSFLSDDTKVVCWGGVDDNPSKVTALEATSGEKVWEVPLGGE